MQVSEGVARPVRGLGQGGLGYLIVDLLDEFTRWEPTTRQYGLAVLAVGAVVSFVQNTAENRGWVTPVLRQVPPTKVPVVDEEGDMARRGELDPDDTPVQTDNTPKDDDGDLPRPEDTFTGEMR